FLGFFATFFPQFLLGNGGMPRRYYLYAESYQALHVLSTAGSWALASAFAITLGYMAWSLFYGEKAGANPWGSGCYEWFIVSPPPAHNFDGTPVFRHLPYDYHLPLGG